MIENIPLSKLRLLERNPRRIIEAQMGKLIKSLEEDPDFLQKRPVLVNKTNDKLTVYAGNQRVSAARKLGWKTIPCIVDVDLDEKVMQSRIIKDNLSLGEFNWDYLGNDYDPIDLLQWGFEEKDLHLDFGEEEEKPAKGGKEKDKKTCPHCGGQL